MHPVVAIFALPLFLVGYYCPVIGWLAIGYLVGKWIFRD
jgi:hypothetical protein